MLLNRLKSLWNPNMYHGWGKTKNYFEGWYFKVVDANEEHAFAFIPGIAMDKDGQQHSFIQVLNGKACTADYLQFEATDFKPSETEFDLHLGDNHFSANHIGLNTKDIQGELNFKSLSPWPKMLGAPGIMGWYSFVPFMECYHGVVSLNHTIEGQLTIKGKTIDFTGGKGYIEKDWGRSFPSSWIWMQTNHFEQDNVSFMASIANIPWLGTHFIGLIAGLWIDGKLYRFATYTGTKIRKAELDAEHVYLEFYDRKYRLNIVAKKGPTGELISPASGTMIGKVNESMMATVKVELYENDVLVFSGTGRNTGMEVGGKYEELLTQ